MASPFVHPGAKQAERDIGFRQDGGPISFLKLDRGMIAHFVGAPSTS